jgi:hypothetical protein
MVFSYDSQAQIMLSNIKGARDSLLQAKKTIDQHKFISPGYAVPYWISRLMLDIHLYQEAIVNNDRNNLSKLKKDLQNYKKEALNKIKKYALGWVEGFRLIGEYYWIIGKQKKSLKRWDQAIKKGEELGARPDLSRTYFQIGKSLLETNSKHRELNGITAEEYLEKARAMFKEMDLQWDLDELDKVMASS